VQRVEQRIAEAEKLGFERIFISQYCRLQGKDKATDKGIEVVRVRNLFDLLKKL
jgi:DNA repair protein RadA/Sms